MAHSLSFLANQKARNAIVGAENLLNLNKKLGMDKAFKNIHVSTKMPKSWVYEKLSKFSVTTRGSSIVKIAHLDDAFLEVFLIASKPSRRSIAAAKRKEKEKKKKKKKI